MIERNVEHLVQRGLHFWEEGRRYAAAGRPLIATHKYTYGLGRFLAYLHATPSGPIPVYFAYAAMARESAEYADRFHSDAARGYARIALTASHEADPVAGQANRVAEVLGQGEPEALFQRVAGRGEPPRLFLEDRIEAAAESRLLLSTVVWKYRQTPEKLRRQWVIGTGGPTGYKRRQRRELHAVLPSCAGMSLAQEARQLASEALQLFNALPNGSHRSEAARRHMEKLPA